MKRKTHLKANCLSSLYCCYAEVIIEERLCAQPSLFALIRQKTQSQVKIFVFILESFQSLRLARGFAVSFSVSLQTEHSAFWQCELFTSHMFVGLCEMG